MNDNLFDKSIQERLLNKAFEIKIAPSLKCLVDRIIFLITDPNSSINDIYKILYQDPALSAKILSIANSAYYNRGYPIYDLHQALMNIGLEETKNVILCLTLMNGLKDKLKFKDLFRFWNHSLFVATSARVLTEKTLDGNPQIAYIGALLHDIGKIVFYSEIEDYDRQINDLISNEKEKCTVENEIFGIDHQEIGYIIAKKWKLPDAITAMIKYHHNFEFSNEKEQMLVKNTMIADNFFYCKETNGYPEKLILLNEKNNIDSELEKNMELLNIITYAK
ncbi:MAG: HDOD domain-containing protein [Syntrophorhabdaceae bacterium]|nr:HDOD domain-containing protein [Syntrophorhabdaceae bacterium]